MLKFLADENFHNHAVRGLRRRLPELDLVRIPDVGLRGADDPTVLEWAAQEGRLLLTHDVRTMPGHVEDRLSKGLPMPGVVFVAQSFLLSALIDDLEILALCSEDNEWEGQTLYLPFPPR